MPNQSTFVSSKSAPGVLLMKEIPEYLRQYHGARLAPLVGKSIARIQVETFEDQPEQNIVNLILDDGTALSIMCDPEGNGPGHIDIIKL